MYSSLSKREKQVYDLMIQGLSNTEICKKLFISDKTVTTHENSIYQKFLLTGSQRRMHLILNHYKKYIEENMNVNVEKLKEAIVLEEKEYEQKIKELNDKLEQIKEVLTDFSKKTIITNPKFSKEENYKFISEQYCVPIMDIFRILKGKENEQK